MDTTQQIESLEFRLNKLEKLVDLIIVREDSHKIKSEKLASPLDYTSKQHAVMQMLYAGMSTKEMTDMLIVSEGTIKVHISSIMKKSGMRSRSQIPALYEDWLDRLSPDQYRRQSGIPMGWATEPEKYEAVTKMLRMKMR
jgi:DNA-binding CsgD family transcriptional regulator